MLKILLVEDDTNLREIYAARLEAEGYQIISASDGEEGLAVAVRERPNLIISDIMMPKISGFDMLDILRSTPETKDIRVIMMTALGQDEDRERGKSLGADHYIVKSQATLDDVVNLVNQELSTLRSQPETTENETSANLETNVASNNPDTSTETPTTPNATTPQTQEELNSPNPTDTATLSQEVEQFVANSPLMNGVPPQPQAQQRQPQTPPSQTQLTPGNDSSFNLNQAQQSNQQDNLPPTEETPPQTPREQPE